MKGTCKTSGLSMELSILSFNSSMMTEILAMSLSVHSTSTYCSDDDFMSVCQ